MDQSLLSIKSEMLDVELTYVVSESEHPIFTSLQRMLMPTQYFDPDRCLLFEHFSSKFSQMFCTAVSYPVKCSHFWGAQVMEKLNMPTHNCLDTNSTVQWILACEAPFASSSLVLIFYVCIGNVLSVAHIMSIFYTSKNKIYY